MKFLVRGLVLGAVMLVVAAVAAPASNACWGDDMAGFYVPAPMQVGRFVLEPGTYFVRAVHAVAGHNAVVITSVDGMKVFATVLATPHALAPHEVQERSRILYVHSDEGHPAAMRSFLVGGSSFGYDIYTPNQVHRQAATVTRELVAIAGIR